MSATLTRRNFLAFDFGDRRRPGDHWIRVHRVAMACRFEVMLSSDDAGDVGGARAALDEADAIESLLTVFRDTSAVSDLNRRAAAETVTVDDTVFGLLARSAEIHAATGGAFDVTSTPLSRCWGFLQREGQLPSDSALAQARAAVGMQHVRLDAATRRVRFARRGVEVNFGAIGKGFALDRMRSVMRERGEQLLAIYHSHPRASTPEPSPTDVRLAYYPTAKYLIIGLGGLEAVVKAFSISEREHRWQQVEYEIAD